jgi:hypothetical protein
LNGPVLLNIIETHTTPDKPKGKEMMCIVWKETAGTSLAGLEERTRPQSL